MSARIVLLCDSAGRLGLPPYCGEEWTGGMASFPSTYAAAMKAGWSIVMEPGSVVARKTYCPLHSAKTVTADMIAERGPHMEMDKAARIDSSKLRSEARLGVHFGFYQAGNLNRAELKVTAKWRNYLGEATCRQGSVVGPMEAHPHSADALAQTVSLALRDLAVRIADELDEVQGMVFGG